MQFFSAANFRTTNHDKQVEDNFPDQQFQKAFQIGLCQGLSRSKRCFSSFQRSTLFGADISGKYYKGISKLNMQTFTPGFSDRKFKQTGSKYSADLRFQ